MSDNFIYAQKGKDKYYNIWHTTNKNMILLVNSGDGKLVCEDKIYPMRKGSIFFVGANKLHYTLPDDTKKYERSKIFIDEDMSKILKSFIPVNSDGFLCALLDETSLKKAEYEFEWLKENYLGQHSSAAVLKVFLSLMILIDKNSVNPIKETGDPIVRAIEYISQNYSSKITIDEIASISMVSKYHFCREFKKKHGITIMEYVLKTRLIMAKALLENSNKSINQISEECGFCSASYFSRVFKKKYGVSPSHYAKQIFI